MADWFKALVFSNFHAQVMGSNPLQVKIIFVLYYFKYLENAIVTLLVLLFKAFTLILYVYIRERLR